MIRVGKEIELSYQPLVSIVTPSYNQGQFIEDTILSVQNQDYPCIEHIVIDGGSTDNTLDILRKYDSKITWISEKDEGQSDAVNKGFAMAKGEIIGWLNSDDLYFDRNVVSNVVKTFGEFKECHLVYGNFVDIDENNLILKVHHRSPRFSYNRLLRACYISQPTTFFRREIIENYELDVSLDFVMDLEFWLRLGRDGWNFRHLDKIIAAERLHKDAKCVGRYNELCHEARQVRRKYGQSFGIKYHFSRFLDKKLLRTILRPKDLNEMLRLYSGKSKNFSFKPKFDNKLLAVLRQLNILPKN